MHDYMDNCMWASDFTTHKKKAPVDINNKNNSLIQSCTSQLQYLQYNQKISRIINDQVHDSSYKYIFLKIKINSVDVYMLNSSVFYLFLSYLSACNDCMYV